MKSPWVGEEESSPAPSKQEEPWPALSDRSLVAMVEQVFSHLLKILNICAHVLDDTPPGPAVKVVKHALEYCLGALNTLVLLINCIDLTVKRFFISVNPSSRQLCPRCPTLHL